MMPFSFTLRLTQVLEVCMLFFQAELPRSLGQLLMRIGCLLLVMSHTYVDMFFPVNFKSLSILVVMIWVPLQCQGLVIPNATEDVTSDTTKSLGLVQFEEQKGFLKIEEKIEKVGHKSEEFNVPSMTVEGSNHLEVTLNVPESLEFEIYPHAKIYPLSSSKKLKNIRNMFLTDSKDHQGFIEGGITKTSEYPKEKRKNFSRRKIPLKKKKASEEKTYCEPTKTTPVVIYQDTDAPPEDVLPRYILRSGVSPIVQDESTMSSPDLDEEIKLNLDSLVMGRLSPIENKPPLYLNTFRVGSANLDDLRVVPEINTEEKYDTGDNFNREVSWSQALSLMNENENISMSKPSKFIWKNDENLKVWNDESDQSPQKETDSVALPNFGNKFNSVTGVIYLSKMEPSSDEVWRENNKLHSMIGREDKISTSDISMIKSAGYEQTQDLLSKTYKSRNFNIFQNVDQVIFVY